MQPELKKTTSSTTDGPAKDNHQASTNFLKLYIEALIESKAWTMLQLHICNNFTERKVPKNERNDFLKKMRAVGYAETIEEYQEAVMHLEGSTWYKNKAVHAYIDNKWLSNKEVCFY